MRIFRLVVDVSEDDVARHISGDVSVAAKYGAEILERATLRKKKERQPFRDRAIKAFLESSKVVSGQLKPGMLSRAALEAVLYDLGMCSYFGSRNPCPVDSIDAVRARYENAQADKAYVIDGEIICFLDNIRQDFDINNMEHWNEVAGSLGAKKLIKDIKKYGISR